MGLAEAVPNTVNVKSINYSPFSSLSLRAASSLMSPRVVFSRLELIFLTAFLVLSASTATFSALASAYVLTCERRILRVLLLSSMTLNGSVSPTMACLPSSLMRSRLNAKPSSSPSSLMLAPLSVREATVPSTTEPTGYFSSMASQGLGVSCLWPRLSLWLASSKSRI